MQMDGQDGKPSAELGRWAKSGAAVGRWSWLRDARVRRVKERAVGRKLKVVGWAPQITESILSVFTLLFFQKHFLVILFYFLGKLSATFSYSICFPTN